MRASSRAPRLASIAGAVQACRCCRGAGSISGYQDASQPPYELRPTKHEFRLKPVRLRALDDPALREHRPASPPARPDGCKTHRRIDGCKASINPEPIDQAKKQHIHTMRLAITALLCCADAFVRQSKIHNCALRATGDRWYCGEGVKYPRGAAAMPPSPPAETGGYSHEPQLFEFWADTNYDYEVALARPLGICLLYTSPSPRDGLLSRMPSSA